MPLETIVNKMQTFVSLVCGFPISRCASIVLVALTWSGLAFCGKIHDAAKDGNLAEVKALVKASPDLVFSKDDKGATALLLAVKFEQRDVAAFLVAHKADVNTKGKDEQIGGSGGPISLGGTPLGWAAQEGDTATAELLLSNKADVNIKNGMGNTPLHDAAQLGRTAIAELLLANKAHINSTDSLGMTPLHLAVQSRHKDVADLLLGKGAKVNAKDNDGNTPLLLAMQSNGDKDIVKLLLANGADINAKNNDGDTPLHLAAQNCVGDVTLAELLLANGADVNAKNNKGYTPLSIPKDYGVPRLTELLKEHGGLTGNPVETDIFVAARYRDLQAVKALLEKNPRLAFSKDSDGNTPLNFAVLNYINDVAVILMANKAVINVSNSDGCTPLHNAADGCLKDMAKLLLAKGADVNARDHHGRTPLHLAARHGCTDVAEILLTKGAAVNAKDNNGQTPLDWVVGDVYLKKLAELLRQHGGHE